MQTRAAEEFIDLLDGPRSATFLRYRLLCVRAFVAARRRAHRITLLVEMALAGAEDLPCFNREPRLALEALNGRFRTELRSHFQVVRHVVGASTALSARHALTAPWLQVGFVHGLIDESIDNWRTKWYDKYQRLTVGIK